MAAGPSRVLGRHAPFPTVPSKKKLSTQKKKKKVKNTLDDVYVFLEKETRKKKNTSKLEQGIKILEDPGGSVWPQTACVLQPSPGAKQPGVFVTIRRKRDQATVTRGLRPPPSRAFNSLGSPSGPLSRLTSLHPQPDTLQGQLEWQ